MQKSRIALGIAALIVLATVLVPLQLTFLDICASGAKTQPQRVRLIHDSNVLDLIILGVSVGAGCMVFSALPGRMKRYKRVLVSLGSIFCSWTLGILAWILNWPNWGGIVFQLIR